MKFRRTRESNLGRRGAAAVEFAVVAPLMFALVFGIIEIGRAVMVAQVLTNASREGARQAALGGTSQTVSSVQAFVMQYLQAALGSGANSSTASVAITDINGGTVANDFTGVAVGDPLMCTVTINFSAVTWLPPQVLMRIMPNNAQINASSVMRREAN